jgi:zinc protease
MVKRLQIQHTDLFSAHEIPHALLASQVTRKTLKNGLTVLVKEVYPASVVCLSIWAKVGSCREDDAKAGISHFVEHMLFKGTKNRQVGKIAQEIHGLGGYINGFTSYDCTCYWIVLPSAYFTTALEIQADAVRNPLFLPEEVEKEGSVIIEEIKMYQDRPESFCYEKLMALAFTKHRYRRPIAGYEDVVASLRCGDLVDFYNSYYRPNNMAVVIVGDVTTEKAVRAVNRCFGGMTRADIPSSPSPSEPQQRKGRSRSYEGDIRSSHLQMGFHAGGIFHPETHACDLLASILGEGRSSRLHQSLREKSALVTGISSSILAEREEGIFMIEAAMDRKNIREARRIILQEIDKVKEQGVTGYELEKAKNMVESSYIFSQETVEGLCKKLGYYEMMGDFTLTDTYIQKLYEVTLEEIQAVARKYLVEKNLSVVEYTPHQ